MTKFKRADIFEYVHEPEPSGTWRVISLRNCEVLEGGLSEANAVDAAVAAGTNYALVENCGASILNLV
jgi:hypothetical protein